MTPEDEREPDAEVPDIELTRREFSAGAAGAALTPLTFGPLTSVNSTFTPLASQFVKTHKFLSFTEFSHTVSKHFGNYAWPVSVSDGKLDALRKWVDSDSGREIVREHEATDVATVSAPLGDIEDLATTSYVEWIDLDIRVEKVEIPDLPGDKDEHPDYNIAQRVFMQSDPPPVGGLAFDAEKSPLSGALDTISASDVTEGGAGYTLGVIDTGLNTDHGTVFGSGPDGSPIRVPQARNEITGEEADVGYSRVESLHETDNEFNNAATAIGVTVTGVDDSAYVEFTPADSRTVTTQTEFQAGTLTDVVATSSDDLELATDGSGNYLSSGTYVSEWFNFEVSTTFLSNTINETLNAETTTWEYRSSPDGTATNASAWSTDITAVPDDQYLQVRVTLNSSDGTATPVVHDYTADVELLSGIYTGPTHTLEEVDRAIANLDLTDASADVTVEAYDSDAGSWQTIASTSTSTTGDVTLDTDPTLDYVDWRVEVVFSKSATGFTANLNSETVQTPEGIDNSLSDWSAVADGNGHGTWVAAAAAGSPTDPDYQGVAHKADILPIKALDDEGSGSTSTIASAVRYGVDNGADVLCMSLGSPVYSQDLADAIQYATDNGVLVVVAAGNDRMVTRFVNYPGADPNTLAVSATTTGAPAEVKSAHFANVGPSPGTTDLSEGATTDAEVGIGAPGMALEAQVPSGYSTLSGTSMAAPFVAGAAVTVLEADSSLAGDAEALRKRLETTAAPAEKLAAAETKHGLLDVEAAVTNSKPADEQTDVMTSEATARDSGYRAESVARGGLIAQYLF